MQSVDRALSIMLLLSTCDQNGLPLSIISRSLDLNNSTCHHILSTLKIRGFVNQDRHTKRYYLGGRTIELGKAAEEQVSLIRVAQPYMEEIKEEVQENIRLAVREGNYVVNVAQASPNRTVRMYTRVGDTMHLHATSVGKVLMAYLSKEEVEEIIDQTGLPKYTERTLCDPEKLCRELKQIKEQGYAADMGEWECDVACIAVPIFDYSGEVVASLGMSSPTSRASGERKKRIVPKLKKVAASISRELGSFLKTS